MYETIIPPRVSGCQSRGGGLDLEHIALPGVDDSGIAALDLARDVDAVVHVDVAVYEIFGFETVQKWEEGFKAAVGVEKRRNVALENGADLALDSASVDVGLEIKKATRRQFSPRNVPKPLVVQLAPLTFIS